MPDNATDSVKQIIDALHRHESVEKVDPMIRRIDSRVPDDEVEAYHRQVKRLWETFGAYQYFSPKLDRPENCRLRTAVKRLWIVLRILDARRTRNYTAARPADLGDVCDVPTSIYRRVAHSKCNTTDPDMIRVDIAALESLGMLPQVLVRLSATDEKAISYAMRGTEVETDFVEAVEKERETIRRNEPGGVSDEMAISSLAHNGTVRTLGVSRRVFLYREYAIGDDTIADEIVRIWQGYHPCAMKIEILLDNSSTGPWEPPYSSEARQQAGKCMR